jgi:hypothetical protein
VSAYVDWAPLGRLGASGLLPACAFLLGQPHHRMGACGALRKLSARKQLKEVSDSSPCIRCPRNFSCLQNVIIIIM